MTKKKYSDSFYLVYNQIKSLSFRRLPISEGELMSLITIVKRNKQALDKLEKMEEILVLVKLLSAEESTSFWERMEAEQSHKDLVASSLDKDLIRRHTKAIDEKNIDEIMQIEKDVNVILTKHRLKPTEMIQMVKQIESFVIEKKLLSLTNEKADMTYLTVGKNVMSVVNEMQNITNTGANLSDKDLENQTLKALYQDNLNLRDEINSRLNRSAIYFNISYKAEISNQNKKEIHNQSTINIWTEKILKLEGKINSLIKKIMATIAASENDPRITNFKDQFQNLIEGLKKESGDQKQQIFDLIEAQIDNIEERLD